MKNIFWFIVIFLIAFSYNLIYEKQEKIAPKDEKPQLRYSITDDIVIEKPVVKKEEVKPVDRPKPKNC